jgi:outer membrane lipoprotein-sorting protein
MFMKTGRKNLAPVLFSPVRETRFANMSILLSTVFPFVLSGIALHGAAAAVSPAPAAVQPAKALPEPVRVKIQQSVAAKPAGPVPAMVAAPQATAELVQIQAPQTPVSKPSPAPPAAAPALDRTAIIDRVNKAFTEVKTAQGKFSQIDSQGGASSGAFYINRPGKVRFDYTSPEPMHIISDGASVSIEEPKRKAYDQVPLSSTPLSLFLRSNVDLKRDVTDVKTQGGSHFVTLVDRTGEAQGKMILEFRVSDFELMGWRALDGDGAETSVKLYETKRNVVLKPSLFIVRDPVDLDRR